MAPVTKKHAAVGLTLAWCLLLAELGARWIFPLPEITNFSRLKYTIVVTTEPGWRSSLANAAFLYPSDPDGVAFVHSLKLYGFRDVTWGLAADRSRPRVMFIGDSFVEGFMAPDDRTIPVEFARLAEEDHRRVEAMNLGVGGAGSKQYYHMISDAVPLFHPDVVVLVLYANDILTAEFHPEFGAARAEPVLHDPLKSRLATVVERWFEGEPANRRWHSAPMNFFAAAPDPANPWSNPRYRLRRGRHVSKKIAASMTNGRFNPMVVGEVEGYQRMLSKPARMRPFLEGANAYIDHHGARLMVAYLPGRNQVTDAYLKYHAEYAEEGGTLPSLTGAEYQQHGRAVRSACEQLGISFLDLTPVLRSHEDRGTHLYWRYDSHLKPAGYAIVARALYEWWSDL